MPPQPIVMIPGLASNGAVWRRTVEALGNDFECLIGDTLQDATLAEMAQRILSAAPPRFVLAGVSMGGMVAMEIMRIAPERVSHLALVATSARPHMPGRRGNRRAIKVELGTKLDYRAMVALNVPTLVHADSEQEVIDELIDMSVEVGSDVITRQSRAVRTRADLRLILSSIKIPTAVIVGEEDSLLPVKLSLEIHELIPHSVLHVIPHCGHLPPIEKPNAVAKMLTDLMA